MIDMFLVTFLCFSFAASEQAAKLFSISASQCSKGPFMAAALGNRVGWLKHCCRVQGCFQHFSQWKRARQNLSRHSDVGLQSSTWRRSIRQAHRGSKLPRRLGQRPPHQRRSRHGWPFWTKEVNCKSSAESLPFFLGSLVSHRKFVTCSVCEREDHLTPTLT